jgi:general secretion pathway protein A
MVEAFFGFKKTPFSDSPDIKQLFASQAWNQVKARLQFLVDHHGTGLLTGEWAPVNRPPPAPSLPASIPTFIRSCICTGPRDRLWICSAKSPWNWIWSRRTTAAIWCARSPKPSCISTRAKNSIPFSSATKLNCCATLLSEQLPLLLNFDMDSSHYLTLLLVGEPLLRRTLSLQMHEPLRQRIAVQYHLDGLSREELDAYLVHQLKAAGVTQPLLDETARQALYQATKGILRKVNKLVLTALRLAATRKASTVDEAILLDATSEALL